jgi:hypothetical protein
MLIDCDGCAVRGIGCPGCLVTALIEPPAEVRLLDRDELWAIEILTRSGFEVTLVDEHVTLVDEQARRPPLRLISGRGRAA